MLRSNWMPRLCGVFLLSALSAVTLPAQTLTTLYSFGGTDGDEPAGGLIQSASGIFYGTTKWGGTNDA
jgi:hypothetical protein